MIIWIDAQLSPALASWITATVGIESHAVRELGLHRAKDPPIFQAARDAEAVVMTKDSDFLVLLDRFGPPPQIFTNLMDHLWKYLQRSAERGFESELLPGDRSFTPRRASR